MPSNPFNPLVTVKFPFVMFVFICMGFLLVGYGIGRASCGTNGKTPTESTNTTSLVR